MRVGDIVRHFLTEQIGVVLSNDGCAVHVIWTTQGLSLFGPGGKEWCDKRSVEVLTNTSQENP